MRAAATLLALLIIIGGAGYYFTAITPATKYIKQGLDLQGGIHLVLEGVDTPEARVSSAAMDRALEIVRYRVDKLGVNEPVIQRQGDRRIVVELAGVKDPEEARRTIGKMALLKFVDPEGNVVLTGQDLKKAGVRPPGTGLRDGAAVTLELNDRGTTQFAEATQKFVGQPIAIVLDDEIVSAPVVQSVINTGQAEITGGFDVKAAQQLADLLNGGALPVKMEVRETRVVSATLGADSLAKSVRAGWIGLGAVALFMMAMYRLPGLLANVALLVYLMLTLAALIGVNAVLTLPGIAGLILGVGMAVDANVLIFERIKEELRAGKPMRAGIHSGFRRAFATVLDSNLTTVLAALILFWLGTGPVRGFALTLTLGIMISMFTAITFTRWLLGLTVATGWFGKGLFGVKGG